MLLPYPLLLACYFPNLILLWHLHFQVRKISLLISSYGKWIFYCRTIRGRESAILTEFTLFSFTCFFFFWVFPRFSFSVSDCIVVLECRVSKLIHMIAKQIQLLLYFSCTCLYVRIRFTYHFVLLNVHCGFQRLVLFITHIFLYDRRIDGFELHFRGWKLIASTASRVQKQSIRASSNHFFWRDLSIHTCIRI